MNERSERVYALAVTGRAGFACRGQSLGGQVLYEVGPGPLEIAQGTVKAFAFGEAPREAGECPQGISGLSNEEWLEANQSSILDEDAAQSVLDVIIGAAIVVVIGLVLMAMGGCGGGDEPLEHTVTACNAATGEGCSQIPGHECHIVGSEYVCK